MNGYLDYSGRDDVLGGGARRIPVSTPAGTHRVWVKRTGNNPALRVLLLHGGPGATHEYLEACDSFLPAAGVEFASRSAWTGRTSCCTGTPGAASWRSSMPCAISGTCGGW